MSETWRVVKRGPNWDRATRTWNYDEEVVATGLSRPEADALLDKLRGSHCAHPEPEPEESTLADVLGPPTVVAPGVSMFVLGTRPDGTFGPVTP